MFFKNVPRTLYNIDGNNIVIPDLFRRVAPNDKIVDATLQNHYIVRDGETPEKISFDFYDTVEFYWTILIVNNIIDPYHDWPRESTELYNYTVQKYGLENINNVNHYVLTSDKTIRTTFDSAKLSSGDITAVTNLEYERDYNEKKRKIQLLKPAIVRDFANQFRGMIRE